MDPAAASAAPLDGDGPLAGLIPDPDMSLTMRDVRLGVDRIDDLLVELIGRRFRFMEAAARIKTDRGAVRDEARKAAILARVEAAAQRRGVPEGLARQLWEILIEASIAYEFRHFDEYGASDGARTRDLRRDRPAL